MNSVPTTLHICPLGWFASFLDMLMIPVMYILSGVYTESPQRTHIWNNIKLTEEDIFSLNKKDMVFCYGEEDSVRRNSSIDIRFHVPIIGGWKKYIVLTPSSTTKIWHIGWTSTESTAVSRIKLSGSVRMLLGPSDTFFFGIDADTYEQIVLTSSGSGSIGDTSMYGKLPLL